MRVISVLRTTVGVDEFPIFQALLRVDPDLVNFDDRIYGFHENPNQIARIERRFNRRAYIAKFNSDIQRYVLAYKPHLLVIFKAAHVNEATIHLSREQGTHVIVIYPDLDPRVHGVSYIKVLRSADTFYFTKPNLALQFRSHIRDDALLISPLYSKNDLKEPEAANNELGMVFVGHYSPGKSADLERMATIYRRRITIIGDGWAEREWMSGVPNVNVLEPLFGAAVKGVYRQAVCNLGLLMEPLGGGWPGDEITARSVLIPASGGALLHPRNQAAEQLYGAHCPMLYRDSEEAVRIAVLLEQRPDLRRVWAVMQQEAVKVNATCAEDLVNQWMEFA
jgi:hypothetical protein